MTARSESISPAIRGVGLDPLRFTWQLLCNVKFALFLVGLAGAAGMLGVVIPQMPIPMRGNPAAQQAWLELRRDDFGALTGPMERLGLFEVFYTPWFNGLWFLIIIAVTVCTVSRLRPTIRSVRRPAKDVGDRYFETAHHRATFTHPGGAEAVASALRQRRYRVERTRSSGDAVYLFAERFSWSQYGTFASHLALLLLLVGGLLTRLAGFDKTLVIAENTPAARVFDNPGPGQMFISVLDSHRGIDAGGNVVDYRSVVEVRRGDETKTCTTTVNDPCSAFGYRVHQAAFFNDLARLRITDATGRTVFDDVLDFENRTTAVPLLKVTDAAGTVLFEQDLPQMGTNTGTAAGPEDDVAIAALAFPRAAGAVNDIATVGVSWRAAGDDLRVVVSGDDGSPRTLQRGSPTAVGAYTITYEGPRSIPAVRIDDMPGAIDGSATVQMLSTRSGEPYLFVTGLGDDSAVLTRRTPVEPGTGYTYTFEERVEASGVSVRRDPGDLFIWVAVALATVGLGITFYVPRRRLWVKVTPSRTQMAGVAERTTRFGRELRKFGVSLGSRDALLAEDLDP